MIRYGRSHPLDFQAGYGVFSHAFRSHCMEEFRILLSQLYVSNRALLLPIDVMHFQQTLIMQLYDSPEIKLCPHKRSHLLQLIKKENNIARIKC